MTSPTDISGAEARIQSAALALFDGAAQAHGLPERARGLIQRAAAFYAAGRPLDGERPDRAARDLALAAPLPGLSADDQALVACAVALQREKVRPTREPAFLRLGGKDRKMALALAALLRVAGALERAQAGGLLVRADGESTTLVVGGDGADALMDGVEGCADLWRKAIGPLTVRAAAPGELRAADSDGTFAIAPADLLALPSVTPQPVGGEPIAEAARRVLRRFFDRLLARADAVAKDEDPEDVHQMRVATRRLRASLQVVEGVYDADLIRRYRRGLRRIAAALGAVRDCDVFLEHVTAYRDSLPEARRAQMQPLIAALQDERARARRALLDDLSSRRYRKLLREFAEFLTTPGGAALPAPEPGVTLRVRDFAGSAIWRRYELWRAYETVLPGAADEALHQARIAGKRLRYTLEFFADALGPQVDQALDPLVALQENLGALQDYVTAQAHIGALDLGDDPGAREYLAARSGERADLLAALPRLWEKVASATYRRRLSELIVKM